MKKWLVLLLVLLPIVLAANLAVKVQIPQWNLTHKGNDSSLPVILEPGNPSLPFYPVKVLIPMGEKVTEIQVSFGENKSILKRIELDYVRGVQPVSQPAPDLTVKNIAVWGADKAYPGKDFTYLGTQQWKGYTLAVINVFPWQYNPVSKELSSDSEVTVTIKTEADASLKQNQDRMLAVNPSVRAMLSKVVVNPEQAQSYIKTASHQSSFRTLNPNDPKKMLIITSQNKMAWFSDYALWKTGLNIPTGVFAIEDILAQYTGVDNPDKLRNFILDAYLTWIDSSLPLEYVILAGDDEIIPIRGVYGEVGDYIDLFMPSDLYYGCLDGNWNANNNNIWGEYPQDAPDLLPEVLIGRFPAETQAEFDNIIRKTQTYVNNNTFSNNIAVMFGENLNWNPLTWGGDYKDDVALHIPTAYHLETHYQRDGTYSPDVVRSVINSGAGIMNHMGHANETFLLGQGNNNIDALSNTEYGFLYSQGCYPAAFDQRTSGDGESIGEHLVTANGALYAFIGNTRYGWYMPGNINGPSQYYDREFFIGLFEQNLLKLGNAMEYSLMQNINNAMQSSVMLWCYYETILFGDPSTTVKLPNPSLPNLALDSYYYDDSEGDGDGNLNPGEYIRLYLRVKNLEGWGNANNVYIATADFPVNATLTNCHISVPQLSPGAYADTLAYIRFQLHDDIPFGTYNFKIRLVAYDPVSGLAVCEKFLPAVMDITLLDSHFPWDNFTAGKSAPVVGDLQFNGQKQIMYVDVFGDGYFINKQGQEVGGFDFGTDENINRSFAVGLYEIINTPMHSYAFTSRTGKIYALAHKDSTTINYINYNTGSTCLYTPVIADLDNNGLSEVIASAHNKKIYVLNYNNQLVAGFPAELSSSFSCELAVADLDNDGFKEIIAGTADGKLWAVNYNGTVKNGFPVQLNGSVTGSPLILDNNNIVAGTRNHMYLVSPTGVILTDRLVSGDMAGGAIPVDINRNGELDIVFITTSGQLNAIRQDGSNISGFPITTGEFFTCPPLAADIDSDNKYEIILQNHLNTVMIYNNDGTDFAGFPFTLNYNGSTPATLTDLDGDGYYELVSGYSNGVLVVKLRKALGSLDAWTVYRGSLSRQGSFGASGFVSSSDEVAIADVMLMANYPNPFNPETTISFLLPKTEKNVMLSIFNSKGQKVQTLHQGQLDKGTHSFVFSGKDNKGKSISSGIYFYRLQTEGKTITRKMLLLK
jgi:hypothetical protein